MGAGDLTTLANVKDWLGLSSANTASDQLISQLITRASAFVLNTINRSHIGLEQFTEMYDGYGSTFMVLRRAPVYQVLALSFSGTPISPAAGDGFTSAYCNGFVLDPGNEKTTSRITLFHHVTPRGRGSVMVRYTAGFVTEEIFTIPDDSYTITVAKTWLGNVKVEGDEIFEEVAADPAPGQYTASGGTYVFNVADQGKQVAVSYSYVPADIEQSVIELVGERFKYKDRIGEASKSLGGQETVSFRLGSMNDFTRDALLAYKLVAPV